MQDLPLLSGLDALHDGNAPIINVEINDKYHLFEKKEGSISLVFAKINRQLQNVWAFGYGILHRKQNVYITAGFAIRKLFRMK